MDTRRLIVSGAAIGVGLMLWSGCSTTPVPVTTAREAEARFTLFPTALPAATEFRSLPVLEPGESYTPGELPALDLTAPAPDPGGWFVFQQRCAGCHGTDGRGKTLRDGTVVPDLVTFGAPVIEPFVYDPAQLSPDTNERVERLDTMNAQVVALQEGVGEYENHGKKVHTPIQWYRSVNRERQVVQDSLPGRTAAGEEAWRYHWDIDLGNGEAAYFNRAPLPEPPAAAPGSEQAVRNRLEESIRGPLSQQQRWDAVYYLWSLSADVQGVRSGGQLFQENCNVCHGRTAIGDGPLSHTMEPMPRNFQNFAWMSDKANQRLYTSIAKGRVYTAMPPWEDRLTPDQIWRIVEYLRTWTYQYPYDWVPRAD